MELLDHSPERPFIVGNTRVYDSICWRVGCLLTLDATFSMIDACLLLQRSVVEWVVMALIRVGHSTLGLSWVL